MSRTERYLLYWAMPLSKCSKVCSIGFDSVEQTETLSCNKSICRRNMTYVPAKNCFVSWYKVRDALANWTYNISRAKWQFYSLLLNTRPI